MFAAAALLCSAAFVLLKNRDASGAVAEIWSGGEMVRRVDLAAVALPYEFEVEYDGKSNTVRVEKGQISVVHADCPDKICVNQGAISNSALPIVCLPNELVIQITGVEP